MTNQLPVFEELRQDQKLCDAVIQVDGKQFNVHKLVLCNCSPYFKAMFTNWSTPDNNVFDIPNLSADIMQVFIEFAYTGVVNVTQDNLSDLFVAADCYSVTGITQACCRQLEENISPQTCLNTWFLTNTYYYPELRKRVFSYILTHFEEVVSSSDFLQLSVEDLTEIIKNNQLNVSQESTVFEAILRWISHSPQDRKKHLSQLLPKVRLALMNSQYFCEHVIGNEMVKRSRKCRVCLIMAAKLMLDVRTKGLKICMVPNHLARPRVPRAVLMAIGGWSGGSPTNCIETYDVHADQWVFVPNDDDTPRAYHGTVFLNGSVYLIGGFDDMEQFCTMHKYDLVNRTWQEVAPMHSKRCFVSVALLDGFIYAMGGYTGEERLETAERYAPQTNQWTMIAPMNQQRSDASSTTFNGKIYICGGFSGSQCLSNAESYNPLSNQWTMISDMSCRRSGVSVIAYAGEIYAVGGFTGMARLSSVEAFNPETNLWRPLPPMMNARSNFGVAVLDDCLFVVGGYNGFSTIHCVESFDVKTGMWSNVTEMEVSRSALSCCVVYDLPNMTDFTAPPFDTSESEGEDTPTEE